MRRLPWRGRTAITIAILLLGLAVAPSTAAFPPPEGSSMKCQYLDAGWAFTGTSEDVNAWVYTRQLQWQMCVVLKSGARYAKVQLSSEAPTNNKWFNGALTVYLDACFPAQSGTPYEMLKSAYREWAGSYDVGVLSGNRFYFTTVSTPSSTGAGTLGWRARVKVTSGVVIDPSGGTRSTSRRGPRTAGARRRSRRSRAGA
jgi:hypothetical protein